jgi:hypothetical protein
MKNGLIEKELFVEKLGKNVSLRIYPSAKIAIDKGWESLYFADNLSDFADVIVDGHIFSLGTYGEVRVISDNVEEEYRGNDVEELRKIIDQNKLDDYILDNNNWFAMVIGKIIKVEDEVINFETIDDMVFEACPKSIEELEEQLIEYAVSLIEHYVPEIIEKAK